METFEFGTEKGLLQSYARRQVTHAQKNPQLSEFCLYAEYGISVTSAKSTGLIVQHTFVFLCYFVNLCINSANIAEGL